MLREFSKIYSFLEGVSCRQKGNHICNWKMTKDNNTKRYLATFSFLQPLTEPSSLDEFNSKCEIALT